MTETPAHISKEYYQEVLTKFKNDSKDEIPAELVHSNDEDNNYKIRTAWSSGLHTHLINAINFGIVRDASVKDQIKEYSRWLKEYFKNHGTDDQPNTGEIIEKGNAIIEDVLANLKPPQEPSI